MLGPKPEADQTGRNAAQQWALAEEPNSQRRRQLPGTLEYAADHPVLNKELEPLCGSGRELPAALNGSQIVIAWDSVEKTPGQNVGGGNRVLNCEIYADPADRRHGVGCIPNTQ